jgi:hypothetical protein
VRNCRVLRDHQGAEISNLIKDKLQKQEMMTLDAICVAHLDEDNYWEKKMFNERLQDPDHCEKMI